MTVTVVCVLKSGKRFIDKQPYRVEHVTKLQRAVARHLTMPHRFACFTDMVDEVRDAGVTAIPLPTPWSGWWSKINLFAPDFLTGFTLYMDLDTLVVGDLTPLIRTTPGITMTKDFYGPDMMNSSTMAWMGDFCAIWHVFADDSERLQRRYDARKGSLVGDQGFIHDVLRNMACPIDTFDPTHVVSFKRHALHAAPRDARLVSFHGRPKPDDPAAGWAYEHWRNL
jgi:hypothetical protein